MGRGNHCLTDCCRPGGINHDEYRNCPDSPLVENQAVQLRRAIVASTIGTMIEWYDFYIYGIVTGLVFGKLFFPESEPLTGTLQAFGAEKKIERPPILQVIRTRPKEILLSAVVRPL